MHDLVLNTIPTAAKCVPWNKGKLTGAKPPLRPKHVWSIRTKLQVEGRIQQRTSYRVSYSRRRGNRADSARVLRLRQTYSRIKNPKVQNALST
jgi:hypothetical protein